MKEKVIKNLMKKIKEQYNYEEKKILTIQYGLEGLYLTATKTIGIFIITILLNIYIEFLITFSLYCLLRMTGFGLHAKKSYQCWIGSIITFVGIPLLVRYLIIPQNLKIVILAIEIFLVLIYAPADTEKRPIINKRKRKIYKILCTSTALIFSILSIIIKNSLVSNAFLFSILIEIIMICPISYKIFRLKYNNYKEYQKKDSLVNA